jgi:hypothetical protein
MSTTQIKFPGEVPILIIEDLNETKGLHSKLYNVKYSGIANLSGFDIHLQDSIFENSELMNSSLKDHPSHQSGLYTQAITGRAKCYSEAQAN